VVVSVSLVVLLAAVAFLLLRNGTVRALPALAFAAFGFFLASTGLAGPVNDGTAALAHLIGQISL
jgi:hypothetical protein